MSRICSNILTFAPPKGEVLEWLKRHAWKACGRKKRPGGSNPPLSASKRRNIAVFLQPKRSKNF